MSMDSNKNHKAILQVGGVKAHLTLHFVKTQTCIHLVKHVSTIKCVSPHQFIMYPNFGTIQPHTD